MPAVLIVEDHEQTRALLSRVFAARGWDVRESATVAEGIAALEPPPECVVIDLVLPDGDGAEVLEKIRVDALPARVVVVATGVSDPIRLQAVSALGPDLIIQKPFDWEILGRYCQWELRHE